jgi:hypothetical protein
MQTLKFISVSVLATLLLCCGQTGEGKLELNQVGDSTSNAVISSSAAVENRKDTTRKFIRTADLKFKVKSVVNSTYDIENITGRQGGFVTYTNLASEIDHATNTPVSADSSLETTYYTVTNSIILRVPNTKLDTTLKEIAHNIDFLDYRIIKADDVALQILSNKMVQDRSAKMKKDLPMPLITGGKKLNETTLAEEILLSKQEEADQAKISNLSLFDQINFSTVNIFIYQRQTIQRELISNDRNIEAYEPGFGKKMLESLKAGWDILEVSIVFLVKIWGVILLVVLGYLLFRKFGPKFK